MMANKEPNDAVAYFLTFCIEIYKNAHYQPTMTTSNDTLPRKFGNSRES